MMIVIRRAGVIVLLALLPFFSFGWTQGICRVAPTISEQWLESRISNAYCSEKNRCCLLNVESKLLRPAETSKAESAIVAKRPVFHGYLLISFLLFAWLCIKQFGERSSDKNSIRRSKPKLTKGFLHSIRTPTDKNALLILALVTGVIWIGDFAFCCFADGYKDNISDHVVIQASTLALLFPLVILIIDKKDESFLNVVSAKEVLLHYAWAFPAAMALPVFSTVYMFENHKIWVLGTTAVSVAIALFVLYRLLKISFSLKTWKDEESDLLNRKIQAITAEDLADRESVKSITDRLKQFAPLIEYKSFFSSALLTSKSDFIVFPVRSGSEGVVRSIRIGPLKKINSTIKEKSLSAVGVEQSKLVIVVAPGEAVNQTRPIGYLVLNRKHFDQKTVVELAPIVQRSIVVGRQVEKNSAVFETLFSHLDQAGRSALEKSNIETLKALRDTYTNIYKQIATTLRESNIAFAPSEDPRSAITIGETENPFEIVFERARRLTRDAYKIPLVDEMAMYEVINLPFFLCIEALEQNDKIAFGRFLQIALEQSYLASSENKEAKIWKHTIDWLRSTLEYNFTAKIKTDDGALAMEAAAADNKFIFLWILNQFQELIHYAIYSCAADTASVAYDELHEAVNLFAYEYIEQDIESTELMLKIPNYPNKQELEDTLILLKTKQKILIDVKGYLWSTLILECAYILYLLESKTQEGKEEQERDKILESYLSRIPNSFETVLNLYLFFHRNNISREWRYGRWEEHAPGQVYSPSTTKNVERIFAVLFSRAARHVDDRFKISSIQFQMDEILDLQPSGQIRSKIANPGRTETRLKMHDGFTEENKLRLSEMFDALMADANEREDERIISSPVSKVIIDRFKASFGKAIREKAFFRHRFTTVVKELISVQATTSKIELFERREAFIEDNRVDYGNLIDDLAIKLAATEDDIFAASISSAIPLSNAFEQFESFFAKIVDLNADLTNYAIFGSIHALNGIVEKLPNYTPNYKRTTEVPFGKHEQGAIKIGKFEIPVSWFRVNDPALRNQVFVLNPNTVAIEIQSSSEKDPELSKLGIKLSVVDLEESNETKEKVLSSFPKFLSKLDADSRKKKSGKWIYIEREEKSLVTLRESEKAFKISVTKQDPVVSSGDGK